LLQESAVDAVKRFLLPLAYVVTPNIPESEELSGISISNKADMIEAAKRIAEAGPSVVIVKGGHLMGTPIDVVWDGSTITHFETPRVETRATHGTGCTYSAAIAAHLAQGCRVQEAIEQSKQYLYGALMSAYTVGAGHSPVHHFHQLWKR
jgi:hydroxymethylpyrimidine/phosphomethylpyrimidine kinase